MLLTAAGAELLSPQNVAVSSPQGSIHSGAQRTGASGRAPRLSLLPSSPMGPWPASWHCCSWREVTRFSRLRGMRPTCTGGSPPAALWGFTPPAAPDPRALSSGRCRAPPQPPPRPSLCGSSPLCPQLWSMQSPSPASSQAQPRHFVGCRTDSPLQSCLILSPASFSWAAPSRRCPF